jgi:glucose-6-phosphate 1-dehydrogenase
VRSNLPKCAPSPLSLFRVLQLGVCSNRLFYFAIPPFAYPGAARAIHQSAMSSLGWSRMVIEKPFGRDSESYLDLAQALNENFAESQVRNGSCARPAVCLKS